MFGLLALGFFASIAFGFADKIAAGGFLATIGSSIEKLSGKETEKEKKEKAEAIKELKGLLKKNPKDLTPKEKKRLQELSKRTDLDLDEELNEKEWAALEEVTGSTKEEIEEEVKENTKKEKEIKKNKLLAVAQAQLEGKENDNSPEAVQARKDYATLLSCVYDDEGNELSLEEIEKNLDGLDKEIKDRIEKQVKAAANDPEALKEFQDQFDSISDEQADDAVENAKAQRLEITKQKKIEELNEKMKKELEGVTGKEAEDIKNSYEEQIKAKKAEYDAKIKEHKDKAAEISTAAKNKQSAEIAKKTKQDLENQKKELEGDDANKKLAEKYIKFQWPSDMEDGDLTSEDKEKKKKAEDYLKEQGLDPEVYRKVQDKMTDKTDPDIEDILADDEIAKAIDDAKKKQLKEIDKKIAEQDKIINGQNTNQGAADPGKKDPPKEPAKSDKPKMTDTEVPVLDDDGEPTGEKIVKKEDGSYVKVDKDGNESEAAEDDWKNARSEFEDFDGDEENDDDNNADKDLDTDYQETDDEKNGDEGKKAERDENGKRINPAKVWKKKKKKNGSGSTKSYYNKKGDSISSKEYREKMDNYKAYVQKHKKSQTDNNSLSDFLRDKLVVERFYPNDISKSKQLGELNISEYMKAQIEV